jgi:hypothetical protein
VLMCVTTLQWMIVKRWLFIPSIKKGSLGCLF